MLRYYCRVDEFHRFIAVIIFVGLISVPVLQEYWAEDGFFGQPFVKEMMSRSKFLPILWNLHPDDDDENQLLKQNNDPRYDRLFKVKPLYTLYIEMLHACPTFYVPGINISIDEQMVASKAQIWLKQYIKDKPTKWGYKLFVLADSTNGYTWEFNIYAGKYEQHTDNYLSYDVVQRLIRTYIAGVCNWYAASDRTSRVVIFDLWPLPAADRIVPSRLSSPC